jgi:hypothetical protein
MMAGYLDGNMLGGALGEVFAVDVTAAVGRCAACGTAGPLGATRVYPDAPGLVARCPACGEVILRLVRSAGRAWLDLRGVTALELALPASPGEPGPGEPGPGEPGLGEHGPADLSPW